MYFKELISLSIIEKFNQFILTIEKPFDKLSNSNYSKDFVPISATTIKVERHVGSN